MRLLDPAQLAQVSGAVTTPQYLIQITLDQPYYLSTRATAEWDGQTWARGDVQLESVSPERCSLRVSNHEYQHSAAALSGAYQRQTVKVWWGYGYSVIPYVTPGYWPDYYVRPTFTDPILIFEGLISSCPEIGLWLTVDAQTQPPRSFPFRKIRAPLANHLPAAGLTLTFGGEVFRIETRRN